MSRAALFVHHVYFPSEMDYLNVRIRAKALGKSVSRYLHDLALRDVTLSEVMNPGALPIQKPLELSAEQLAARQEFIEKQFGVEPGKALILGRPEGEKEFGIDDIIHDDKPDVVELDDLDVEEDKNA